MGLDPNPLIQKLAAFVAARPNATDFQLEQYLVFHNGAQWPQARALVAHFRKAAKS